MDRVERDGREDSPGLVGRRDADDGRPVGAPTEPRHALDRVTRRLPVETPAPVPRAATTRRPAAVRVEESVGGGTVEQVEKVLQVVPLVPSDRVRATHGRDDDRDGAVRAMLDVDASDAAQAGSPGPGRGPPEERASRLVHPPAHLVGVEDDHGAGVRVGDAHVGDSRRVVGDPDHQRVGLDPGPVRRPTRASLRVVHGSPFRPSVAPPVDAMVNRVPDGSGDPSWGRPGASPVRAVRRRAGARGRPPPPAGTRRSAHGGRLRTVVAARSAA